MRRLTSLCLDDNLLGEVPIQVRELVLLDTLSITRNYIVTIPPWLATTLTMMRRLDVSHNAISAIPDNFGQLANLEQLFIAHNLVTNITPMMLSPNLTVLDLSHNALVSLDLPPLEALYSLDISYNRLRTLGPLPYHLNTVTTSQNYLDSLEPRALTGRSRELTMTFSRAFRDVAMERIYRCWYTRSPLLDLSGLALAEVPAVVGSLVHLTALDLSANCLVSLPADLARLTALTRLDLSANFITVLPLYLVSLKGLASRDGFLGLSGTLDYLTSPPRKIAEGGITDIQRYFDDLFLGEPSYRVKLMIVGQENVGKTSLVKCLKLKKKVAKAADHLGSNVSTDGIDIEEIKCFLETSISASNHKYYYSAPTTNAAPAATLEPSINVTGGSNSNNTGSNTINSGGSASSSGTSSGQTNNNSNNNNNTGSGNGNMTESTTPLVPSSPVAAGSNSSSSNNNNSTITQRISLSVWDCAGQELYYTTHQMFLTDTSLYTVVWDLCKPEVNSKVEFWLHSIRAKTEDAPILLVGTHLDDFLETHTNAELEGILDNIYHKYFRRFKLKGIAVLSCATCFGLDTFQDLLKRTINDLPAVKQRIPDLYLKLERLIVKKRSTLIPPVLTWKAYCQMVLSNLDFHDEIHLKVATKALVSLGSVAFFDEPGLDNYVFLDPQWLTNVFSSIITTKHNFIRDEVTLEGIASPLMLSRSNFITSPSSSTSAMTNGSGNSNYKRGASGKMQHSNSDLKKLNMITSPNISSSASSAGKRGKNGVRARSGSTDMMSDYSASSVPATPASTPGYEENNQRRFIVPSQLPDRRPAFDLLWPPRDQFRIEYNRWYQLNFAPIGLFSRLIIRLLVSKEFAMKPILYWRNGMVIEASPTSLPLAAACAPATALVEMSPGSNTIKISVRSDMRTGRGMAARLLRLIVEIADVLCTCWYSLEASHLVPCPHCISKGATNLTLFELSAAEAAASAGDWYLSCGARKIALDSFVPDVALVDFWGTGSKKFAYESIAIERETRTIVLRSIDDDGRIFQPKFLPSPGSADLPISFRATVGPTTALDIIFDEVTQTVIVSGTITAGTVYEYALSLPKLIGRGASGKIYRATLNSTTVAVKHLDVAGEEAPRIFSEFRRELHLMSELKHRNVVNLHGFTVRPFTMVLEHIEGGDLYNFLHSDAGAVLDNDWPMRLRLALDVARGMDFLHSVTPPLLHRDLKSPNILLTRTNGRLRAKVGDFGLSSRMFLQALRQKLRNFPVGNITWVAPEILREDEYTVKSDVFAYGLIMHELMTRQHPYREYNHPMLTMLERAIKEGVRPSVTPEHTSSLIGHDYCALMRDCWDGEPSRRPTFARICKRLEQLIARANLEMSDNPIETTPNALSPLSLSVSVAPRVSPLILGHSTSGSATNRATIAEETPIGGQLQMSLRTTTEHKVLTLAWESRRVWGGTAEGAIVIWNAENGKRIMAEPDLHKGPISAMLLVDEENIWTAGEDGVARVWNAWRLNCDDQVRFKSDMISKKGRGTTTFSRKSWMQRWFILDRKNKSLSYYKRANDKQPKATLQLTGAQIDEEESLDLKLTIDIVQPEKRRLLLEFRNEYEKEQWENAISRIIHQNVPIHEISLLSDGIDKRNAAVSCMLLVNGTVWVAFLGVPEIAVFDAKMRARVGTVRFKEYEDWKGTDRMILQGGFVWLSHNNLLAHVDPVSMQVLAVHAEHMQPILSMASVDRNVWASCQDGSVTIWDGQLGSVIKRLELASPISKLLQFGSHVWACTFGSIYIYDPLTFTVRKQVECKQHVNSITELIRVFQQTVWSSCGGQNICIWS
eukprot:gene13612-16019_t